MVSKGRVNWSRVILTLCCALAVTLGGVSAAWAKGGNPVVKLTTNKGDIVIELDKEKAPATTARPASPAGSAGRPRRPEPHQARAFTPIVSP